MNSAPTVTFVLTNYEFVADNDEKDGVAKK